MKDYKKKIEDLVEELNLVISDPMVFPEQRGNRFELTIDDGIVSENGADVDYIEGHLRFIDGDKNHAVMRLRGRGSLDFYRDFYLRAFRALFLTIDYVIPADEVNGTPQMAFLNFKTLATEGLKSLNK